MAGIGSGEFWMGSNNKMGKRTLKTKEQNEALKKYLGQGIETTPLYGAGSDFLQSLLGGGPNAFSQFEAPYMQQFQQQIAPGIAERFSGMGTGGGAQSSSGLNQALAAAGGNLQNQLASLHGNLQMQALPQALAYAQQPYTNQLAGINQNTFENYYQPGSTGFLGETLQGFTNAAMGGFGEYGGQKMGQKAFGPMSKPAATPGGLP